MGSPSTNKSSVQLRKRFIIIPGVMLFAFVAYVVSVQFEKRASARKAASYNAYMAAVDRGDTGDAITHLSKVIEEADDVVREHFRRRRAMLQHTLGNNEEAFAELNELIEAGKESDDARHFRAVLSFRTGKIPEAVRDLEVILPASGSMSDHLLLGVCKLSTPIEAIEILSNAIEMHEGFPRDYRKHSMDQYWQAFELRATAYAIAGELQPALDDLNLVIESSNPSATTLASRARVLCWLDRAEDAETDARAALGKEGESGFLLVTLAMVEMGMSDWPAATRTLERAVRTYPDCQEARDYLGLVRVGNGEGIDKASPKAWGRFFSGLVGEANRSLKKLAP